MNSFLLFLTISLLVVAQVSTVLRAPATTIGRPLTDWAGAQRGNTGSWGTQPSITGTEVHGRQPEARDRGRPVGLGSHSSWLLSGEANAPMWGNLTGCQVHGGIKGFCSTWGHEAWGGGSPAEESGRTRPAERRCLIILSQVVEGPLSLLESSPGVWESRDRSLPVTL